MVLMFSLLLTLSRGAYLGLAVFWFVLVIAALAFRVDARLVCTRFTISFVLAVIAVSIIVPSIRGDLKQMVRGRQSASQTRSTEGHFAVWRAAWTIARSHPLLGVGPGNFAMHYVPEVGKSSERAFVGRPLNLFVQIVVERGIVGAASFLMLLLALFRSEIRVLSGSEDKQQRSASIIRLSALSAVLARELSYSSLLINPLASLLFWLLMAGVATDGSLFRRTGPEPVRHVRVMRIAEKVTGLAWMLLLAGSFLIFYIAFIHANAAGKANEAVQYWAKGEYQAGFESIGAAIRNDPGNAYYISMLGLEQGRLGLQSIQSSALSGVTPDVASRQIGFLNSAIGSYQSAGVANPLDDNFANNLGWLYFFLGDNKNAEGYLRRALEINSGEALYHIGLGILLEGRQRISDANIEYSAALTVRPEFIDSPSFLSLEQERPDRARTIIASSISMLQKETMRTSSPIAKARLGGLLLKSGHSREAIPFLQDAVKSLPGLSLTWANLGSALHDVGNDQAANTALKKSLFLRTNPESLNDAADSPHVKGDNNRIWDLQGIGSERRTAFRTTEHAARVSRVYRTTSLVRDDVLPPGFLEICIPSRK
jgi:tetratricopeptide (TPR) repeat protein